MPVSDEYAVETRGLGKRFGELVAVEDVDLRVPRGSAFGYLGRNGAGKTTLIRMLLGLIRPSEGEISLLGLPQPQQRRRALERVGAVVEEPRFHPHMSGRRNLWAIAAAHERSCSRSPRSLPSTATPLGSRSSSSRAQPPSARRRRSRLREPRA